MKNSYKEKYVERNLITKIFLITLHSLGYICSILMFWNWFENKKEKFEYNTEEEESFL